MHYSSGSKLYFDVNYFLSFRFNIYVTVQVEFERSNNKLVGDEHPH